MSSATTAVGAVFCTILMISCVAALPTHCDVRPLQALRNLIADLPERHAILETHSIELIPADFFLSNINLTGLAFLRPDIRECPKRNVFFQLETTVPLRLTALWRSSAGIGGTIATNLKKAALSGLLKISLGEEGVQFELISSSVESLGDVSVELEGLGVAMDAVLSVLGANLEGPAKTLWAALLSVQLKRILGQTPPIPY
ncbi:unnamed protein product [Ixodes pacificus]